MKQNIAVIFGSRSTEHDISILSAIQIMNAIDKEKYEVFPIYITQNGKWLFGDNLKNIETYSHFKEKNFLEVSILPSSDFLFVKKFNRFKKYKKIDAVILSLHGKNGEDGTIQGLLELAQIPYSSSGVLGSAIGIDKDCMKQIFLQNKIPITKYESVTKNQFEQKNFDVSFLEKNILYPMVVKPNSLGSSIGISIIKTRQDLFDALKLAFMFDNKVLVEKFVENLKEVNVSVLGDYLNCKVSITEEVGGKGEFLSFEKKYLSTNLKGQNANITKTTDTIDGTNSKIPSKNGFQNMDRIMPANISKQKIKIIENLAKKIFNVTNSKGVVRIDFMINQKTGKIYANEINSIPGSFAFYLWQKSGIDFAELADKLISIAKKEKLKRDNCLSVFSSSVLKK